MLRPSLALLSLAMIVVACNAAQPGTPAQQGAVEGTPPAPSTPAPSPPAASPPAASTAAVAPAVEQPAPHCDVAALGELSGKLDAADEGERPGMAWSGIEAACGEALPEVARLFFGDALAGNDERDWTPLASARASFHRRGCSEIALLERSLAEAPLDVHGLLSWEGCNIGRFEGLSDGELQAPTAAAYMTWSMHQLLLDEGLAPLQAVSLTRALFVLELRTLPAAGDGER